MIVHVSNFIFIIFCVAGLACATRIDQDDTQKSSIPGHSNSSNILISSEKWAAGNQLHRVESIIYDFENKVLYASNGIEYKPGTDGYISKISDSGVVLEKKWIEGLNRPTGISIYNGVLYVADVNVLVLIDINTSSVIRKFNAPTEDTRLNDVTISATGRIFVSASDNHAILELRNEKLTLFARDEQKLAWANGLTIYENKIIVAGLRLASIDLSTGLIEEIIITQNIEDFDGIIADGNGGFYLTSIDINGLWYLDKFRNIHLIEKDTYYFGDMCMNSSGKSIYVAQGNLTTNYFFIGVYNIRSLQQQNR